MNEFVLDTHAVTYWLFEPKSLPQKVINILTDQGNKFLLPVMVILEIQYLIEVGRIDAKISDVLNYVESTANFTLQPFDVQTLLKSIEPSDHRDPFDRIILATARAHNLPIITKDRWMRDSYSSCIWK